MEAGEDSRQGGRFGRKRVPGNNAGDASGVNSMTIKQPRVMGKTLTRDDEGALHPSWEARKKAKEKDQQNAAFQGKKIVFD